MYPVTRVTSKQLLPIYDKPMIYYPLSVLMLGGIRDILIISTPRDLPAYKELLGDGRGLGLSFTYKAQERPRGLADAFIVGEDFIGGDRVALILGDNVFYGQGLSGILKAAMDFKEGGRIFAYTVKDPREFGVVEFDGEGNAVSLEEKPKDPKTNYAVPGLYFYDRNVVRMAKSLKPSPRGELEITDLNKEYMKAGLLKVINMGRGMAWLDTGTNEGLLEASSFVAAVQKRQGFYVACIEEIAFRKGYIDGKRLMEIASTMKSSEYGTYLREIARGA